MRDPWLLPRFIQIRLVSQPRPLNIPLLDYVIVGKSLTSLRLRGVV